MPVKSMHIYIPTTTLQAQHHHMYTFATRVLCIGMSTWRQTAGLFFTLWSCRSLMYLELGGKLQMANQAMLTCASGSWMPHTQLCQAHCCLLRELLNLAWHTTGVSCITDCMHTQTHSSFGLMNLLTTMSAILHAPKLTQHMLRR